MYTKVGACDGGGLIFPGQKNTAFVSQEGIFCRAEIPISHEGRSYSLLLLTTRASILGSDDDYFLVFVHGFTEDSDAQVTLRRPLLAVFEQAVERHSGVSVRFVVVRYNVPVKLRLVQGRRELMAWIGARLVI